MTCLHTEPPQIPPALMLLTVWDEAVAHRGLVSICPSLCICCLRTGQTQTSMGTAGGFGLCLV